MKKTLTTLAVIAMCAAAAPAFANHTAMHKMHKKHHCVTKTTGMSQDEVAMRRDLQTRIEASINKTDLNADHKLSADEYTMGMPVLQKAGVATNFSFKAMDKNKDGQLSSQELMNAKLSEMHAGPAHKMKHKHVAHKMHAVKKADVVKTTTTTTKTETKTK